MPDYHHLGKFLVYFNGVEVPATSVSIQLGNKQVPSASITMPPDRELIRLGAEDRVQVAVFYLDNIYKAAPDSKPEYRIIFEGEITSWSYDTQARSRSINFQAAGLLATLSRIKPVLMTNVKNTGTAVAGAQGDEVFFANYPTSLFYQGLRAGKELQFIKRPYDFVENIFKALFGADNIPNIANVTASPAVAFFAKWARRTNFVNRWAPSPYVEGNDLGMAEGGTFPILAAVQGQEAIGGLIKRAQRVNTQSMMNMLLTIFQSMYYEFTAIPNMPVVKYDLKTGVIEGPPDWGAATEDREGVVYGAGPKDPMKPVRMLNHVTKPELAFCAVPRCNIIFPSMITGYNFSEDIANQITRLYINDETLTNMITGGNNAPSELTSAMVRYGYPPKVRNFLRKAEQNTNFNDKNLLIFPEEYFRGPVVLTNQAPEWLMIMQQALLAQATAATQNSGVSPDVAKSRYFEMMRGLLDIYSKYEYFRERMSLRNGAVGMLFNPYIAPGFPAVVIDREDTGMHVFCYIQNVTHTLSASGMGTTVNYAYAQTFDEFFATYTEQAAEQKDPNAVSPYILEAQTNLDLAKTAQAAVMNYRSATTATVDKAVAAVAAAERALGVASAAELKTYYDRLAAAEADLKKLQVDAAAGTAGMEDWSAADQGVRSAQAALVTATTMIAPADMAPAHPIPSIRLRFQVFKNAREYYRDLFYQKQEDNLDQVFDWQKMIGIGDPDNALAPAVPIVFGAVKSTTRADGTVVRTMDSNAVQPLGVNYVLLEPYKVYATDPGMAMAYVSRPVATLDDYINFIGDYGQKRDAVIDDGPATYYAQILNLEDGPGTPPVEDAWGNPTEVLDKDTRRDWTARLLNYRNKMKSKTSFRA